MPEPGCEPYMSPYHTVTAHLESFRLSIQIGSLMDGVYSVGLGPTVIRRNIFGVVLYWVAKEPYVV